MDADPRFVNRSHSRKTLAGVYRIADVALVTRRATA